MTTHKLLESEIVIPDDGNMFPMYCYIIDGVFAQAHIFDRMSVAEYKREFNVKEIRRCEIFGHPGAKVGDKVE